MSFDDFIERLEKLGSKKEIMASSMCVFQYFIQSIFLYCFLDEHTRIMKAPLVSEVSRCAVQRD